MTTCFLSIDEKFCFLKHVNPFTGNYQKWLFDIIDDVMIVRGTFLYMFWNHHMYDKLV